MFYHNLSYLVVKSLVNGFGGSGLHYQCYTSLKHENGFLTCFCQIDEINIIINIWWVFSLLSKFSPCSLFFFCLQQVHRCSETPTIWGNQRIKLVQIYNSLKKKNPSAERTKLMRCADAAVKSLFSSLRATLLFQKYLLVLPLAQMERNVPFFGAAARRSQFSVLNEAQQPLAFWS